MALAWVALAIGCGARGPETIKVDGTVTWKSKPVAGAVVTFSPEAKGTPATAVTDAAGRYQLTTFKQGDGALAGNYRVAISAFQGSSDGMYGAVDESAAKKPRKSLVPEKYSNPTTSGLKATVSPNNREFDFNLAD